MQDVFITGIGIACPLGIGNDAVWTAIENRRSGVRALPHLLEAKYPIPIAGEVPDFDPKRYVKPRKSLKVMSRETQLAFTAATLAWEDAQWGSTAVDPERLGVNIGANLFRSELTDLAETYAVCSRSGQFDMSQFGGDGIRQMNPLWLLKYLPNMSACHVGIAHDARGPINSIVHGDVSSLLSIIEATNAIDRGHADVMLAGGTSTMLSQIDLAWHGGALQSHNIEHPATACRPFDAERDGMVCGEGAAILVLESRAHVEARQGRVLGQILGYGRRFEPVAESQRPTGVAVRNAMKAALAQSDVSANDLGHVNAHGVSTVEDDSMEAQAIRDTLGDVPVTAPKSFFGNLGAGSGAVELAISLLAGQHGCIPPTLNYRQTDPRCPVNVVTSQQPARSSAFMALNHRSTGQAVAVVVDSM